VNERWGIRLRARTARSLTCHIPSHQSLLRYRPPPHTLLRLAGNPCSCQDRGIEYQHVADLSTWVIDQYKHFHAVCHRTPCSAYDLYQVDEAWIDTMDQPRYARQATRGSWTNGCCFFMKKTWKHNSCQNQQASAEPANETGMLVQHKRLSLLAIA